METQQDIENYLRAELQPAPPYTPAVLYDGRVFRQTHGFRRAMHIHAAFASEDGQAFAFHVEDELTGGWQGDVAPNFGVHDSWDSMITGVAAQYVAFWGI